MKTESLTKGPELLTLDLSGRTPQGPEALPSAVPACLVQRFLTERFSRISSGHLKHRGNTEQALVVGYPVKGVDVRSLIRLALTSLARLSLAATPCLERGYKTCTISDVVWS